jgi:hypothetical protein
MGRSFRWDRKNRGPVSQQVWHDKDPSLLKGWAPSIGQNFAPFTGNGDVSISEIFLSGTYNQSINLFNMRNEITVGIRRWLAWYNQTIDIYHSLSALLIVRDWQRQLSWISGLKSLLSNWTLSVTPATDVTAIYVTKYVISLWQTGCSDVMSGDVKWLWKLYHSDVIG